MEHNLLKVVLKPNKNKMNKRGLINIMMKRIKPIIKQFKKRLDRSEKQKFEILMENKKFVIENFKLKKEIENLENKISALKWKYTKPQREKNIKILQLFKDGLKYSQISKKLNILYTYVWRYIHYEIVDD
jgi:regulator of replication initiation timing